MTEDRLNTLERRIDALQLDHEKHESALDSIASNVQAILQQIKNSSQPSTWAGCGSYDTRQRISGIQLEEQVCGERR